jgi:hypothetical protein
MYFTFGGKNENDGEMGVRVGRGYGWLDMRVRSENGILPSQRLGGLAFTDHNTEAADEYSVRHL